jgi:hypothetical protein
MTDSRQVLGGVSLERMILEHLISKDFRRQSYCFVPEQIKSIILKPGRLVMSVMIGLCPITTGGGVEIETPSGVGILKSASTVSGDSVSGCR